MIAPGILSPREYTANGFERDELHAAQRFAERYGRMMTADEYEDHITAIRSGGSTLRGVGGGQRELHAIETEAGTILAVYCPHWGRIVTYLQRERDWRGRLYGRRRS
jgi:hypothetical protein